MEEHPSFLGSPAGLPRAMLVGFLDAVPASAAILDRQANVIAVNQAWRRFATHNGGDPEGWVGRNYLGITEGAEDADARLIAEGLRAVLDEALCSFDHEYPCHGPSCQRWFRCLVAPLIDEAGTMAGASVMHLDITAEKSAEHRAQAASRAKSEFLASMSHELRTPLNAIIGFSEMMTMGIWGPLGDSRYQSYADDIHRAGKHLLSLINEVLDLSKVEAGRFDLNDELLDTAELVRQTLPLVAHRAGAAGVNLAHDLPEGVPPMRADARLLRQILLNLLSNAVKFTPKGGSITTSLGLAADGWVELAVADTGIGIASHDIDRAMQPFGQVDSEVARRYAGESTGLGLPLCRGFVELHGGHLHLDSMPGQGTKVTARFPPQRLARM